MTNKQKKWYQYSRALLLGCGISLLVTLVTLAMHFAIYVIFSVEFKAFFGASVGSFVWWKYLLYFMWWATSFTLIFRNEWELL